jgi:hypothetical protein
MKLANFHSHRGPEPYHVRTPQLFSATNAHPPFEPHPISFKNPEDLFSSQRIMPFEESLHRELLRLEQMTSELNQKISSAKNEGQSQDLQPEFIKAYSLIERSKKMLTFFVEQMQKSMENISSNFR